MKLRVGITTLFSFCEWQLWKPFCGTLVRSETVTAIEGSKLDRCCSQQGEVISFLNVVDYACRWIYGLDVHRFFLSMRLDGSPFMVRSHNALRLTAIGDRAHCWLHWNSRRASWCYCQSNQTESQFVKTEEECQYDFCLSAMIVSLRRNICAGNFFQALFSRDVDYFSLKFSYFDAAPSSWFPLTLEPEFEHFLLERISQHRLLLVWHNVKVFAVWIESRSRVYVPVELANSSNIRNNSPLLVPSTLVFSYYSNLFLARPMIDSFATTLAESLGSVLLCSSCESLLPDSLTASIKTQALKLIFFI